MTAVAKLWEDEKLDLDAPIQKYIPSYPQKTYNGEEVSSLQNNCMVHFKNQYTSYWYGWTQTHRPLKLKCIFKTTMLLPAVVMPLLI